MKIKKEILDMTWKWFLFMAILFFVNNKTKEGFIFASIGSIIFFVIFIKILTGKGEINE